ncbi:hypothetical protein [Escherichia coli]|uniref:hypothetical protein n=1 Tax=Escherichia coli TaxID=562 RepID=UPI001432FD2D|nr:hypothetical protein [Escherichia coli]NJZ74393.1 hypothetical protein [Escherichia coli]
MSKVAFSAIALALLGSSAMANAADLTTETTVTATVVEPAKLTLTYAEGDPIIIKDGIFDPTGLVIGTFTLSGYKSGTHSTSVNFTDAAGTPGLLTLTPTSKNDDVEPFTVYLMSGLDGAFEPQVNGSGYLDSPGVLADGSQDFVVQPNRGDDISAGNYSDNVTVTVSNQ